MTVFPVTNYKRMVGIYDLNITARHMDTLETKYYTELIVRTVKLWLYVAKAIGNDLRKLPDEIAFKSVESSVEELITKDDPLTGYEFKPWPETRITVFDWNHKLDLTVHSSSLPQACLDIWWAMTDAEKELDKLYPKDTPQSAPEQMQPATPKNAPQQPPAPNTPTAPQNAANANVAPVEGVLVATTWPDKKKVQYADGQLVSYTITKIKAAFFKGSPTYELYTSFGGNYPGFTVYKFKSGTQELTQTYESIVGVLATLGLTLEQPEAIGTWRVVIKANHSEKDGVVTEYKNVQSLTAL